MIRRLLLLNGLAIIGVVLNHTANWGFVAMFWWTDRYAAVTVPNFDQLGNASYMGLRIIEQLIIFSIPAFLFVSGFFVAIATGRNRSGIGWGMVGTRVFNLVLPYLLWSTIILATDFILLARVYSAPKYAKLLLLGGATDAYYYVPVLCQLYLLAPLLIPAARRWWKELLSVTFVIQWTVQAAQYPAMLGLELPLAMQINSWVPNWFFATYIFWFTAGIVVGFHLGEFKAWLANAKWFLLATLVISIPLGIWEWEAILRLSQQEWLVPKRVFSDELTSAAFILTILAFDGTAFPFAKWLNTLGTKSYGIYLIHSLVLVWVAKVVYRLLPQVLAHQALYQPLLITLGLAVPLLFMALVQTSPVRRYYQYIFG